MPRKKSEITSDNVETVSGAVEGLSYSQEEMKIREQARRDWAINIDWDGFGKNQFSEMIGVVYLNRARKKTVGENKFTCGAELAGAIDSYWCLLFDLAEHNHTNMPDVEGLADFLGVTRDTLIRWRRGEANLEFIDPLNLAFNEIAQVKKQFAMQGRVNGLVYLNDMQNNHGYLANTKSGEVNLNVRLKNELPDREHLIEQVKLLP